MKKCRSSIRSGVCQGIHTTVKTMKETRGVMKK